MKVVDLEKPKQLINWNGEYISLGCVHHWLHTSISLYYWSHVLFEQQHVALFLLDFCFFMVFIYFISFFVKIKDYDDVLDLELDSMDKFVLQCLSFYQVCNLSSFYRGACSLFQMSKPCISVINFKGI